MTTNRVQAGYGIQRVRKRHEKPTYLDDPAFRSRLVSFAGSAMSRRGAAALAGISHVALHTWLERGRAEPEREPYGSFACDYLRAERGLELAASGTISMVVAQLYRLAKAGDWEALNEMGPQLKELLNVLASRWPEDWGTSSHRRPEQEPSGEAWLERNTMTHEQLTTMLRDPPEQVAMALLAAGYVRVETKT